MKAVLLNSGGIDTLASVMKLKEDYGSNLELHSMIVGIGQENFRRARLAAKAIAMKYCTTHDEVILPGDWTLPVPLPLMSPLPQHRRTPYMALLLHTLGIVKARFYNLGFIVGGFDEYAVREEFPTKFVELQEELSVPPYTIQPIYPVAHMTPGERIDYVKDHYLVNTTVSCALPNPCGVCCKCRARLERNVLAN